MAVYRSLRLPLAQKVYRNLVCSLGAVAKLALLLWACSVPAWSFATMTSAATVHSLSRAQAGQRLPVHLVATVTYYDSARRRLFVEDSSGGVAVKISRPYPLQVGDLIDVAGTTEPGYRGMVARDPAIQVIGKGMLPATLNITSGQSDSLIHGEWDARRVTLHGIIRSATVNPAEPGRLELIFFVDGCIMQASVLNAGNIDPVELLDADFAITGTLGTNYNARMQFISLFMYSNDGADLKLVRKAAADINRLPLTPIDKVLEARPILDQALRVHVRGAVTYYRPGRSIVIQQDGRSVSGSTWQRTAVPLGSVVDLTGFVYQDEFGPVLKQVMFKPTGQTEPVKPTPVAYAAALKGTFNDEIVSIRGRIVSQNHSDTSDTLQLLVDHHQVTVDLQEPTDGKWLPALRPGSDVVVIGICRATLTTAWDRPGSQPAFFRIDMRSAGDLTVLRQPSVWTLERLLRLFAVVCVLSLIVTLWAIALRRRVSWQTAKLKASMRLEQERNRVLHAISSDCPLPDLLEELCSTCDALMPRVCCGCAVTADEHLGMDAFHIGAVCEQHGLLPVYASRMEDAHGDLLGHFHVSPQQRRALTDYEQEVFEVFGGLATLAVTQRRLYQVLNYTSTHDQLTGLPNRRLADSCLELAIQQRSIDGSMVAVIYIDLDHFKQVNDQHGHKTGDQYLQLVATRMRGAVRSTDTLARVGGDEFLLIASGIGEIEEAEAYRTRLTACFAEPFLLECVSIPGAASIGVAVAPDHGTRAEDLKRRADLDMYAAKHHHRTGTDLRTVSLDRETYTVADIEAALEQNRFHLFYQPQCSPDGTLLGLEALLRLNDPLHGTIAPDAFIGVAERNDVIHSLGAWVLREALNDAVQWNLPALNARMMVNISIRQAEHPDFALSVLRIIEEVGISPDCVELEITERMLMNDMPQAIVQLGRLRQCGVHIAIDDFGVEHSCLSLLHNLPFDTLKLDRTFIRSMNEDLKAMHIVGAIVAMANALGKRVVAEGVETQAHVQALAPFFGVDLQGYYFSRPRPASEIAHALKTWGNSPLNACSGPVRLDAAVPQSPSTLTLC